MITERLSPELQAEYDALLQRSAAGRDRIAAARNFIAIPYQHIHSLDYPHPKRK